MLPSHSSNSGRRPRAPGYPGEPGVSASATATFPTQSRELWVDALFIYQSDDAGKSHQVNLVDEIYLKAERALLWLGEVEEGPNRQGPLTSMINESAARIAFSTIQMVADGKHVSECLETSTIAHQEIGPYEAVRLLLDLPWWNRI